MYLHLSFVTTLLSYHCLIVKQRLIESKGAMPLLKDGLDSIPGRAFSAPSKAMVAGGYLVLDPAYRSFVTALSCRMHACISTRELENSSKFSKISVSSPQFGGHWNFIIGNDLQIQETTGSRNPFLEATIRTVIGLAPPSAPYSYQITLFSDPGYHTQEGTTKKTSRSQNRTFLYHDKPIDQVPKTGMGLSAGFVTVVTASILSKLLDKPLDEIRDVIHKVAQIAHCDAQGKIGSGFDVATAVYGSIIYRRFKPEVISHILGRELDKDYCSDLARIINSKWELTNTLCSLPPGIKMLIGDVKSGSETPKLVSKVLAWRKCSPESAMIYEQLNSANEAFMRELSRLSSLYNEDSDKYMASLSNEESVFVPLKAAIADIRLGLQLMTAKSGADIEPVEQTRLLDNCLSLPGCLGGVVPGAGGYDAICIFVEERKVDDFKRQSALNEAFNKVTWLDLTEESLGLLEESFEEYVGF